MEGTGNKDYPHTKNLRKLLSHKPGGITTHVYLTGSMIKQVLEVR